jgi:hypothetical protein
MSRTFTRDDSLPWVGSISALRSLMTCPQQFQNKYIRKVPRDCDWTRPTFFAFGSAAHACLELCRHDVARLSQADIKTACDAEGLTWETDGAKVAACLRSYGANAKRMTVLAVELEVLCQNWVRYLDAVLADETHWYMADTKFVALLDPHIKHKLRKDNQIWLYMSAHEAIEKQGLVPPGLKFGGFFYREVVKPAIKKKKNPETWEEFTLRCGTPDYRETHVPYDPESCNTNLRNLGTWLQVARGMKPGDIVGRNYNACINNGVVCETYSQCHGYAHSSISMGAEE